MTSKNSLLELLVSLEQQLNTLEVRSSAEKLSKLLAPGYYEHGPAGKLLTREDVLNRLPNKDDSIKFESHSFKMTPLSPDASLLTFISKKINADGSSLQYLKSSVWKNNNGQWQLEFQQGTTRI